LAEINDYKKMYFIFNKNPNMKLPSVIEITKVYLKLQKYTSIRVKINEFKLPKCPCIDKKVRLNIKVHGSF
jgi:hypothetical protein